MICSRQLPVCILASSSMVLAAGAARASAQAPVQIKFMTYNVQSPGWNPARRAQVVATIASEAPDVLGLHEASPGGNGDELLADLMGDYEPHHTDTGDPIYLRLDRMFTVLNEGIEDLPVCDVTPGGAAVLTWVKVETPEGVVFDFYNTHLCVSQAPGGQGDPEGNQLQAVEAAEFISTNSALHVTFVLAGDLNANQNSPTILYLIEGQPLTIGTDNFENPIELRDTWAAAPDNKSQTHPGTGAIGGFSILDWILATPSAAVTDAEVIQFDIPPGQQDGYSDHLPVTATLELCVSSPGKVYGDVDNDGDVDLFDLFCILNCFENDFSVCSLEKCDIEPCAGDADTDLFDLFAVLNAFSGVDPCCGG